MVIQLLSERSQAKHEANSQPSVLPTTNWHFVDTASVYEGSALLSCLVAINSPIIHEFVEFSLITFCGSDSINYVLCEEELSLICSEFALDDLKVLSYEEIPFHFQYIIHNLIHPYPAQSTFSLQIKKPKFFN